MIIQIGTEVDESMILWKHKESDEWERADVDDLIRAYEDRPKREWTPVSERLPSEDGEYIVTMGKDGFDKEGNVTWAMFNKLKKGFYFPTDRVNYYIAVTAWQPLPEPYKGDDTENPLGIAHPNFRYEVGGDTE